MKAVVGKNQQVGGSNPPAGSRSGENRPVAGNFGRKILTICIKREKIDRLNVSEGFPSGQRGQTVNLLAQPSEVRILPPPFAAVDVPWGQIATQAGVAQLARASAFQAEGRRFESGFPLQNYLP